MEVLLPAVGAAAVAACCGLPLALLALGALGLRGKKEQPQNVAEAQESNAECCEGLVSRLFRRSSAENPIRKGASGRKNQS